VLFRLRSTQLRDAGRRIDVPVAVVAWLVAFVVGNLIAGVIVASSGADSVDTTPLGYVFAGLVATWAAYLAGLWAASQRGGSGVPVEDYRLRFAPIDLIGAPIGVITQLVVVPVVYLPLRAIWEGTFSDDRLSENADSLVDRADGAVMVLLVVMVCIGAPIVEELVYRGMIQGSLAARFDDAVALVASAAWFALIHFRPVEYPGLFVFGLVAGAGVMFTKRIGMSVVAHVAFNATGLLLAV